MTYGKVSLWLRESLENSVNFFSYISILFFCKSRKEQIDVTEGYTRGMTEAWRGKGYRYPHQNDVHYGEMHFVCLSRARIQSRC